MTKLRTRLAAFALSLLLVTGATAGPPRAQAADEPLTLIQALQRAVAGNIELRRERITIEIEEAQLEAALGQFDFRLDGAATFSRTTNPPVSEVDLAGGFTNRYRLQMGLARALETGGNLRFQVDGTAVEANNPLECGRAEGGLARACTNYTNNVSLRFDHPLLRGFGSAVTLAAVRRQRILRDQALLNRQTRAAIVLRDIITAYWELAYATRDLAIRQSAVDLAREQLRITRAQIDVGRLARIEEAAVERAIGERMQEVVLSEQTLYFRSLELRRMLGQTLDPTIPALSAADAPQSAARDVDVPREVARALESNPQLRALRLGQRLSEVDILTAQSTVRPRLDFIGSIGSTGRNPELRSALETAFGLDNFTWTAGLQFELPLQNRTARGNLRSAELGAQRVALDATGFELELRELVLRLASSMRTASKRVDLARATVGYAQQNLEAERARFSVGRATNNDVLLRQQELKNVEISLLRATVDLLTSEVALNAATGELLDRYNVVLRGS